METIQYGYRIPFISMPPPCILRNNSSCRGLDDFISSEIRYIEEVHSPPHCCNPLTVAKGKKLRLILDLRHVNQYVQYCPIKYEDWGLLEEVVKHDDYFISFDLTAGYHHVSELPEHTKFLGSSYCINGVNKYYVFCQMPFGLSTACYLFTKLMRPLVKLWQSEGVRSFVYIDDGVMACNNLQEAGLISNRIKSNLHNAGFLINHSKSNWIPTKHLSWLGFEFDSSSMTLKVALNERKVEKLLDQCRRILQVSSVSPRQVAVAVGQLTGNAESSWPTDTPQDTLSSFLDRRRIETTSLRIWLHAYSSNQKIGFETNSRFNCWPVVSRRIVKKRVHIVLLLRFGDNEQCCSVCGSRGRGCKSSRGSYDSPSRDCGAGRRMCHHGGEHKFLHTVRPSPGSGWAMFSRGRDWTVPRRSEVHGSHGRHNSKSQKWPQQCHSIFPAFHSNSPFWILVVLS